MERKVLVIGKKNQLSTELMTRIIAALKASNIIAQKEQIVDWLTLNSMSQIPQKSVRLQTTTTLMIGLKESTSTELVRRINYAHQKTRVEHFIVCTEGAEPIFRKEDNASVHKTLEVFAEKDFSTQVAA